MRLDRRIKTQLTIFVMVTVIAGSIMTVGYMRLPTLLFGTGHYTVTLQLPRAGGLYEGGNVTYRGTEVGRVTAVQLTATGVAATLSLRSDIAIPSDLDAAVHSATSIGEQYVALTPRSAALAPLKNGAVIPESRASVPSDINGLIDATNRGLQAIPRDNLKTIIDESYTAIGGLGPQISDAVHGSTQLAIDARANLDPLIRLIDQSSPVLDSQAETAGAIDAWAAHLATITHQLQHSDVAVAGLLSNGPAAAEQARQLIQRLRPTVPMLMANLASVGEVALAYQPHIEQILVLVPQIVAELQGAMVSNRDTKQDFKGAYLDFNLNLNLPPPCTTGYLPAQQRRSPSLQDYPDMPAGDVYCRIPQDSSLTGVRGARNLPCATAPGKRAPTVQLCESDQQYVPLNDGTNWKGDPNATLSGQDIPQLPPGSAPPQNPQPPPAPPPLAVAPYDPASGSYIGPDGQTYTQTNLGRNAPKEQTWQSMLIPQTSQ